MTTGFGRVVSDEIDNAKEKDVFQQITKLKNLYYYYYSYCYFDRVRSETARCASYFSTSVTSRALMDIA